MFRRLKLSVTQGPINESSSDISLFLSNLYLQHSIIDVLEFPSLFFTAVYFTTKWHNKEKRESNIIYTTQPPKSPLLYSSALWNGLFWGLDPNDHLNPDPVTDASPKGWRVRFPNCIRSDMGRVGEESMEGVGSRFGLGGAKFSTAYRSFAPIWIISAFLVTYFC